MYERHMLFGSCGRSVNVATKIGAAALANDNVFFDLNRRYVGRLHRSGERAE
jgi:hypothetical protein